MTLHVGCSGREDHHRLDSFTVGLKTKTDVQPMSGNTGLLTALDRSWRIILVSGTLLCCYAFGDADLRIGMSGAQCSDVAISNDPLTCIRSLHLILY